MRSFDEIRCGMRTGAADSEQTDVRPRRAARPDDRAFPARECTPAPSATARQPIAASRPGDDDRAAEERRPARRQQRTSKRHAQSERRAPEARGTPSTAWVSRKKSKLRQHPKPAPARSRRAGQIGAQDRAPATAFGASGFPTPTVAANHQRRGRRRAPRNSRAARRIRHQAVAPERGRFGNEVDDDGKRNADRREARNVRAYGECSGPRRALESRSFATFTFARSHIPRSLRDGKRVS